MLTPEVLRRLDGVEARLGEIDELLCRPEVASDRAALQKYSRERADAADLVEVYRKFKDLRRRLEESEALLGDPEMKALAQEEVGKLRADLEAAEKQLTVLLLPTDPFDKKNIII